MRWAFGLCCSLLCTPLQASIERATLTLAGEQNVIRAASSEDAQAVTLTMQDGVLNVNATAMRVNCPLENEAIAALQIAVANLQAEVADLRARIPAEPPSTPPSSPAPLALLWHCDETGGTSGACEDNDHPHINGPWVDAAGQQVYPPGGTGPYDIEWWRGVRIVGGSSLVGRTVASFAMWVSKDARSTTQDAAHQQAP